VSEHKVKVADWAAGRGDDLIVTIGLGSCVAIALHDPETRIGALAHILLPHESMSRDASNRAKFAGSAVPLLVEEMRRLGSWGGLVARIAGGASMFAGLLPSSGINMGERNVEATRRALEAARIPIVGEDTGADYGRSVYFHVGDGRVVVKSLKSGDRVL
jgi:chemotaxis protein CheD